MEKFKLENKELNITCIMKELNIGDEDIRSLVDYVAGTELKNVIGKPYYIHGLPSFGDQVDATYEFIDWYKSLANLEKSTTCAVLKHILDDLNKGININCNIISNNVNERTNKYYTCINNLKELIKEKELIISEINRQKEK